MKKKTEEKVEEQEAISSEMPPAEQEEALQEEAKPEMPQAAAMPEVPWTMGTWKGLPQWRCRLCPWDTLKGEAEMRKHIEEAHLQKRPRRTVVLPLVDRYGNLIKREVDDGQD
jgi:hypothetical protein